jgi:hypothetical protein
MGTRRTGSYLLAIFALLWLGMIYVSEFGWPYTIDAVLQPHGNDAVVMSASPALPGDRLYPMVLAGRVVGVIATGVREDLIRQENAVLHARLAVT